MPVKQLLNLVLSSDPLSPVRSVLRCEFESVVAELKETTSELTHAEHQAQSENEAILAPYLAERAQFEQDMDTLLGARQTAASDDLAQDLIDNEINTLQMLLTLSNLEIQIKQNDSAVNEATEALRAKEKLLRKIAFSIQNFHSATSVETLAKMFHDAKIPIHTGSSKKAAEKDSTQEPLPAEVEAPDSDSVLNGCRAAKENLLILKQLQSAERRLTQTGPAEFMVFLMPGLSDYAVTQTDDTHALKLKIAHRNVLSFQETAKEDFSACVSAAETLADFRADERTGRDSDAAARNTRKVLARIKKLGAEIAEESIFFTNAYNLRNAASPIEVSNRIVYTTLNHAIDLTESVSSWMRNRTRAAQRRNSLRPLNEDMRARQFTLFENNDLHRDYIRETNQNREAEARQLALIMTRFGGS